jgi:hypothetical protein
MMKRSFISWGITLIFSCLVLFIFIDLSYGGDLGKYGTKKKKNTEWSFSFYGAMVKGGKVDGGKNTSRTFGPSTHLSGTRRIDFLTNIKPTAWMIEIDYRMSENLGLGILYSYSDLGKTGNSSNLIRTTDGTIISRLQVSTVAALLIIHINEYIIFGIGPTLNIINAPPGTSKVGLLGHLNIRIPVSPQFAFSGIIQYRYVGGALIGSYNSEYNESGMENNLATNVPIYPPTEIRYSHLFLGLGISITTLK